MDIKELLDQFTLFDPAKGQRADLPAVEGNYIVVLKAGCNIPDVLGNFKYTEISLHGADYRVLYTGIASDLKRRIWTNHLSCHWQDKQKANYAPPMQSGYFHLPHQTSFSY